MFTTNSDISATSDNIAQHTHLNDYEPALDEIDEELMTEAEGLASTKGEYRTISIPSKVRGTCNNTVTIAGVISAD